MNLFKPKEPTQSKRAVTIEVFHELAKELYDTPSNWKILDRLRTQIYRDAMREDIIGSYPEAKIASVIKRKATINIKEKMRIEVFNEIVNKISNREIVENKVLLEALLRLRKKIDPEGDLRETKDLKNASGSTLERVLTRLRKEKEYNG